MRIYAEKLEPNVKEGWRLKSGKQPRPKERIWKSVVQKNGLEKKRKDKGNKATEPGCKARRDY